ncbi:aromatic-ring-hydroxylating dioxygenase subunit beta [Streptomyces sp. NPDC002917]|uniref:aromatic-ring-hydroxylating dioxygenase subunit beta n=1 Tax=unclassified Streptomyces TaxID=2593676 RepID=UPI002E1443B9|nr:MULTISPECIES: 3-phenylpropionate/cinnamic acid dioxygenase subunit beta [unclassified Streptomyces]WSJ54855.1 3-phenylpropionate/cinnamic acid dioxygenase subunit beta [Streptomyces sp. NBC_01318]WTC83453.1 3-phenylpropionate/cinnamic acid dioxygenase subunit beta [Streptomyces sp. NBC_01653]WTD31894.1 3-phenylpropionate/cinnamic acid dioxygenase subunit beta [Streptomyces sp. NBC_01643]WTD87411.1 3-phenylpropionate/cinnamic acid dioxygenase subunit beta [Streptomyces sp. NBC_01637]WUC18500
MVGTSARARVGSALYNEVVEWMDIEAELLDAYQEREWLETMVSRDVVYQVPIRQTVERARGNGFVAGAFHLDETYGSLESRVARNETAYAWAEDPPSRIRHFVTGIRVAEDADDADLVTVRSNLLVYRTRQEQTQPQLLSGERRDRLRREDGTLRLLRREVLLDLTVIGTHNLSIFF